MYIVMSNHLLYKYYFDCGRRLCSSWVRHAIFVVRQLQEKYLAAIKRLYMAFIDFEKAFD